MRDVGREKRCFLVSPPFLFPNVLYAIVGTQDIPPTPIPRNRGVSIKPIEIPTVSTILGRPPRERLAKNRSLIDPYRIECRFDRPRRSSRCEIGDERRALTSTSEELLVACVGIRLWRSDAPGCRPQRVVLRSRLVLDCDWSVNEKKNESILARASRSSDSFSLSLPCLSVSSWKVRYIYCESRSCYALDALFIFFLCFLF